MPYLGGKNASRPAGKWVAAHLPASPAYAEVFGGMMSMLLNRPPASCEIYNDVNGDVYHWWRIVREQPDELQRRLDVTPYSEDEYLACCRAWEANEYQDDVDRARVITVLIQQGFTRQPKACTWIAPTDTRPTQAPNLRALSLRLRHVVLYNRDALDVLERLARKAEFLIYCDPPYRSTPTTNRHYRFEIDYDALEAILRRATARIALSGFGDEWDGLGWHKDTLARTCRVMRAENQTRTESIWTNYEVQGESTADLFGAS